MTSFRICGIKTLANVVVIKIGEWTWLAEVAAEGRSSPPSLPATPLFHSDPDGEEEPPSQSGSHVKAKQPPTRSSSLAVAKKPRKDCRITDLGVKDELVEWFRGTQLVSSSLVKGERMSAFTNDRQTHEERQSNELNDFIPFLLKRWKTLNRWKNFVHAQFFFARTFCNVR